MGGDRRRRRHRSCRRTSGLRFGVNRLGPPATPTGVSSLSCSNEKRRRAHAGAPHQARRFVHRLNQTSARPKPGRLPIAARRAQALNCAARRGRCVIDGEIPSGLLGSGHSLDIPAQQPASVSWVLAPSVVVFHIGTHNNFHSARPEESTQGKRRPAASPAWDEGTSFLECCTTAVHSVNDGACGQRDLLGVYAPGYAPLALFWHRRHV